MKLLIMRDNEKIGEVERGDGVAEVAVLSWFHRHVAYSAMHAIMHEGYSVVEEDGTPWLSREDFITEGGPQ